jgi:O-antigen/teichoic acid export membrane protein
MSRNDELAKNTLLLGVSKIATQMLLFLLVPIYTKYFTTEAYGAVDLIMTYIALAVPFLTVQLELSAFRFALDNRDDDKKLSEILSTIFSITLPITSIALAILFVISIFTSVPYVFLIALNIFSSVFLAVLLQFARGIGKTTVFAIASIVAGIATVASSIALVVILNWNASSIILSATISNIITLIYLVFAIGLSKRIHLKYINSETRKPLLRYSLPLIPNNLSWWILNVSDRTIIAIFLGVAANGIYAIAYKLAFIPNILFGIFNMSWMEASSLHINSPDKDAYFSRIFNATIITYSCIAAVFIAFMAVLFPYLVGSKFSGAYNYMPILVLGGLSQAVVGMYSSIYLAKKKTKEVANTTLYAAVINLIVNLLLVNFIGLYASAMSTLVAFLAMMVHRHYDVQKYVIVKYDKLNFAKIGTLLLITTSAFYLNNTITNIVSILISAIAALVLNHKILKKAVEVILTYIKNTNLNKKIRVS